MNSDFEPPPKGWSTLATVGGVLTALLAISVLQALSNNTTKTAIVQTPKKTETEKVSSPLDKQDDKSMELPGKPVPIEKLEAKATSYVAPGTGELTAAEKDMARQAWQYFELNWNEETGLVNSVDKFISVTLWDQAAGMAALVSARELGIVPQEEFEKKMGTMLKTLATMPLYKNELPNKVYNSKTLIPVNYGQVDKQEEIGWSAIDLGRMALWLKIVGAKYPQFRAETRAVWEHWKTKRLANNGQMFGTAVVNGAETYNQEGRLGYENYAAYGLRLWGMNLKRAEVSENYNNIGYVDLYGKGVPYDLRDHKTTGANNYVLSEPFILDGIETGFQALPKPFADRVLEAQEARYKATKLLTAVTEDNLDREPYFVYSSLFVNGEPWSVTTDTRKEYNNLRFISAKASIGWHVLYNTPYTQKLFDFVQTNLKSEKGWYNGFYESLREPNKSLTANNNGVIMEALLYKKIGKPFTEWAGVEPPRE